MWEKDKAGVLPLLAAAKAGHKSENYNCCSTNTCSLWSRKLRLWINFPGIELNH